MTGNIKVQCPKCGELIRSDRLITHKKGNRCNKKQSACKIKNCKRKCTKQSLFRHNQKFHKPKQIKIPLMQQQYQIQLPQGVTHAMLKHSIIQSARKKSKKLAKRRLIRQSKAKMKPKPLINDADLNVQDNNHDYDDDSLFQVQKNQVIHPLVLRIMQQRENDKWDDLREKAESTTHGQIRYMLNKMIMSPSDVSKFGVDASKKRWQEVRQQLVRLKQN